MALPSSRARAAAVGVALLVVGAVVGGVVAFDRPSVAGIDTEWGTVTEDRTQIRAQIAVDDAGLLELVDGVASAAYTVSLNDVRVADGRTDDVRLDGERGVITATAWMDNDRIPEWWASHVARGETTTVRITSTVTAGVGGLRLSTDGPTRTRTVRTDLLAPMQSDRTRSVTAFGRTLLTVESTDARWGSATVERTPLIASATVTNPTPVPIPITDVGYTIRMNGVRVGEGTLDRRVVVPPGATRTVRTRAVIDNARLEQWWVSHLRNDETTDLSVDFHATVEYAGTEYRIPLDALSYDRTFETDFLAGDGSAAAAVVSPANPAVAATG